MTESSRTLSCLIKEGDFNLIQKNGVKMKAWFHSFDEVCESYLETLTNETDITADDSYYDVVNNNYMDQLDSLNLTMDTLSIQAPVIVKGVLPQSSTLQVQDDQCHKSIQFSTHQQNTELATNNNPTHPELHPDDKAQLQDILVTDTQKELPNVIVCVTSVINQSLCVIIDSDIDDDILVQSPTPCTQYSHTHHATIHPASVVRSTFQLENGRSADHHILTVPPQDQLELKESYIHSQTPRPGRKVKDGTLHITSTPRPAACFILSGVT